MSTSLYQEWFAARLSALCAVNEKMVALAESLMTEGGGVFQAGVRLEAAIIYSVCCRHQRTLASQMEELSVAPEVFSSGHDTSCHSVPDIAAIRDDQSMIKSFSRLCDLRAMIAAAQFSYDELGNAVGFSGFSANRDDLFWMRDECAAYNRRLEKLVNDHQERLVSPGNQLRLVSHETTNPLSHPCVDEQMASLNAATHTTVHEAC